MSRFMVVPASYIYLVRGTDVLLQRRQNTGYMDGMWAASVAGHIERGETAADAAIREAAEELGITVSVDDLRPSSVMQRTDGSASPQEQRVDWFFRCEVWQATPQRNEPDKVAELRWFALDDLPQDIATYEHRALQWLRKSDTVGFLSDGFD